MGSVASTRVTRARLVVAAVGAGLVGLLLVIVFSRAGSGPPQGRLVYTTSEGIVVRDLRSGDESVVTEWPSDARRPTVSADGRYVAYELGADVFRVDLDTGERVTLDASGGEPLAWTPEGRLVLRSGIGAESTLTALELDGSEASLLPDGTGTAGRPVFLGDVMAVGIASDPGAELAFVRSVDGVPTVFETVADAVPLASEPGGGLVAAAVIDDAPRIELLRPGGDGVERDQVFVGTVRVAAMSPGGHLAFAGNDTDGRGGTWYALAPEREPVLALTAAAQWLSWSRDGDLLLYWDGSRIFELDLRSRDVTEIGPAGDRSVPIAVVP